MVSNLSHSSQQQQQQQQTTPSYTANFIGLLICFPIVSVGVAFTAYVFLNPDKGLQASTAFGTLSLFSLLRFPLMMLGQTLNNIAQAKVSLNRISTFLEKAHEIDNHVVKHHDENGDVEMKSVVVTSSSSSSIINLSNVTYAWRDDDDKNNKGIEDEHKGSHESSSENKHFSLTQVDLVVKPKELIAVVGRVGSGKTTLLRGLLGELYSINDHNRPRGILCYAPQTPWIVNASVRENILLASECADEQVYRKVLSACGLLPDLETLSDGDRTIIGERGVTLSGGWFSLHSLTSPPSNCYTPTYPPTQDKKPEYHWQERVIMH